MFLVFLVPAGNCAASTYFSLAAKRLLCDFALSIDVNVVIFDDIIVFARELGE